MLRSYVLFVYSSSHAFVASCSDSLQACEADLVLAGNWIQRTVSDMQSHIVSINYIIWPDADCTYVPTLATDLNV